MRSVPTFVPSTPYLGADIRPAGLPVPTGSVYEPAKPPVVPLPKPKPRPASAKERNERRLILQAQPIEAKLIALALLPETPRSMSDKLTVQIQKVEALKQTPVADAAQAAAKERAVAAEAAKLAGILQTSQVVRDPTKAGVVAAVAVPKDVAKTRLAAAKAAAAALAQKEKELRALLAKQPSTPVRAAAETQLASIAAQKAELARRQALLAKGYDTNKPQRFAPGLVSVQREPVKVPVDFKPPSKGDVVTATMILTAAVKPKPGESAEARRKKLHALLERILARKAAKERLTGPYPTALQEAVAEAIQKDEPVIEAELRETGGVAKDDAADAMSPFVDEAAEEIARAAASEQPVVPASSPTPAEVEQLLLAAREEAATDAHAPKEEWDELREDVVLSHVPVSEASFLANPRVWVAGGLGLAVLLWFGSRR